MSTASDGMGQEGLSEELALKQIWMVRKSILFRLTSKYEDLVVGMYLAWLKYRKKTITRAQ
jgi:hypothetical protein